MNDLNQFAPDDQSIPPLPEPAIATPPQNPMRLLTDWLKRLFVCNPFYLVSAALLLYGVHRISMDGGMFVTETSQILFNFSALQIYEVLLALTATLLVTRRIWYDAALLVALENMLWVVPFILVSQAAFIAPKVGMIYCAIAVCLLVLRAMWLRYRGGEIAPSARMLWCGLPVLIVNAVWPVLYRHFGETKIGITIPAGAAYEFNEFSWFWLLPMLAATLLLLPRADSDPQTRAARRWFPLLWLAFWLAGTSVHLYALGYIYDFDLRREQLAPTLWVLAWALHFRLADFLTLPQRAWNIARLFLPVAATTLALAAAESRVFFYLSALNFVGYGILLLRQREDRLVLQLGLVSFAAMVAALPIDFRAANGPAPGGHKSRGARRVGLCHGGNVCVAQSRRCPLRRPGGHAQYGPVVAGPNDASELDAASGIDLFPAAQPAVVDDRSQRGPAWCAGLPPHFGSRTDFTGCAAIPPG
jgi:hypothetical protein